MKNWIKISTVFMLACFVMQAQPSKIIRKVGSQGNQKAASKLVKAATLSDEEIMSMTREAVEWMDNNNPVADPNTDPYGQRLAKLTKGLENYDGLNLNFKVYKVVDINAFATADGSVRVFAGLMDLMNDDELMSVIGHEIGHVKNEHSKRQMKKALTVSGVADLAASNTATGQALKDTDLSNLMENFLNAQFSQTDESESDEYGFVFMVDNGLDYHAQEGAFKVLMDLSDNGGKGNIMSSHPGSAKRTERAQKRAADQDAKK